MKREWIILIYMLIGAALGNVVTYALHSFSALHWLKYGMKFGTKVPFEITFGVIDLTAGITINITIGSIVGMVIAVVIFYWLRGKV